MNHPELSPSTILAFRKNDLMAFQQIYELYFSFVYKVVIRMVRSPHMAEDLVQDIFLKVYDHRKKYDPSRSFSTWLYQVSIHHVLNHLKREQFLHTHIIQELFFSKNQSQPFLDMVEKEEEKELVLNLFQQLPRNHQVCLILRDVEGLSYQTIAEILKLNLNTVKTRIHRSREMLADLYLNQKQDVCYNKSGTLEGSVLLPQVT